MNFLSINSIYKEIKWRLLFKKLRKIEFLILDVDGVLTDGGLWFQNDGYILKSELCMMVAKSSLQNKKLQRLAKLLSTKY